MLGTSFVLSYIIIILSFYILNLRIEPQSLIFQGLPMFAQNSVHILGTYASSKSEVIGLFTSPSLWTAVVCSAA